jgi:hypothetical protein
VASSKYAVLLLAALSFPEYAGSTQDPSTPVVWQFDAGG